MRLNPMKPIADNQSAGRVASALNQTGMRQPRRTWRWILAIIILAAAVGAGIWAFTRKPTQTSGPVVAAPAPDGNQGLTVTVAPVTAVQVPRLLMVTGTLGAWDELPIGTSTSGLAIVEVLVDEGDKVKAGQVLTRFDDSVLRADLLQKEAALREAEAVAAEAAANVRRAEELARAGHVSQRELENRRASAATAQARVGVAQANREQSLARLRQTEIKAPTDGTITRRNARLGAVMSSGGTELFRMIRDNRIELAADVPERDLEGLAAGQKVALNVDGVVGSTHQGTIRLVSPTVDPRTRLGTIKVDVPTSPALKPGMFMIGRVELGQAMGLSVPETAVVYKDAKPLVFVLGDDSKVQMRGVETGIRADGRVILTKGVQEGDRVVVSGAGFLKEGDPVIVASADASDPVNPLPKQN